MNYQALPKLSPQSSQVYARIDDDGLIRVTCIAENPEFQAWLEGGNEPLPADEPPAITWDDIRTKRDQLIKDSDWTMTADASVNQAAWAEYRQKLRDLPQTYAKTGPESVVWLAQPSTTGPNTTPVE